MAIRDPDSAFFRRLRRPQPERIEVDLIPSQFVQVCRALLIEAESFRRAEVRRQTFEKRLQRLNAVSGASALWAFLRWELIESLPGSGGD